MLLKLIINHDGDMDNFSQLIQSVYYDHGGTCYIFCSEDGSELITTDKTALDFANYAPEYNCQMVDAVDVTKEDIALAEQEMDDPVRVFQFIAQSFHTGDLDGDLGYIFNKLGFPFDSWEESGLSATEIFEICGESLKG